MWMGVACPCPPVRNDIVTPRHLFIVEHCQLEHKTQTKTKTNEAGYTANEQSLVDGQEQYNWLAGAVFWVAGAVMLRNH